MLYKSLLSLSNLPNVTRGFVGYSTIAAQATNSLTGHVLDPQPSLIHTIEDSKDPVLNLQKVKTIFDNKHGLWSKIGITTHLLRDPTASIRIGLIGSQPSLLNTLLSDPFASDQTWYNSILKRSINSNNVIRYLKKAEISDTFYDVPSPILHRLNLEFLELNDENTFTGEDGCHLYISFQEKTFLSISKWPVYDWRDIKYKGSIEENEIPELSNKQINSKLSEKVVSLLSDSPENSIIYTKLMPKSNISEFNKFLERVSEPSLVLNNLYECIIRNLTQQLSENSITIEELDIKDARIKEYIQQWDEASHREFQKVFKPYVTSFESKNLQWWKLYYNADDVQAIFTQMINTSLLKESLKNYSYIKGQIDSFSSFQKQGQNIDQHLSRLDQNALTVLKDEIARNELVTLQNRALKILLINSLGTQLPIILLSIGGAVAFDFSLESMIGLGSLGVVIGFNNISKQWLREIKNFKLELFERVRVGIVKVNESLYSDWSIKYEEEKEEIMRRENLINNLKADIDAE